MRHIIRTSVVLLCCSVTHGQESLDAWINRKPQWYGVLVFTAPWCGPCVGQKQALDSLARDAVPMRTVHLVRQPGEPKRAAFVLVDYDTNRELAARYGVKTLPAFVAVHRDRVIATHEGLLETAQARLLWERAREGK